MAVPVAENEEESVSMDDSVNFVVGEQVAENEEESVSMDDSVNFIVGERFETYEKLEEKLKKYKTKTFCELWKRDARTIEAARKRMDRPLKTALRYYDLKFCCIHGGQTFRSKSKGIRSTS